LDAPCVKGSHPIHFFPNFPLRATKLLYLMHQLSEREREILQTALRLPPKERVAYLDQACAGDAQLRQRIVEAISAASASSAPQISTLSQTEPTLVISPPLETPGEKPGDQLGRYKLLEQIGEGGMGSVWVAEQRELLHRKVALKVIKLGMDTKQVIGRFEAERQALALMDHPNIAKVLDAGATEKGRPFFVMELVNGVPITEYCDRHQLSTRDRLDLFIQVCQAVQHAHEKGIIHRDIKPTNILVAIHDRVPVPKVIDFGIAKAIAGQPLTDKSVHTALEEFIGTPAYMSPEQAEMSALRIDARSDIYSLGVLLYELLTGLTPFKAELFARLSTSEIRRIIREQEPPRPSTSLTTLEAAERATIARRRQCEPPKLIHLIKGDLDWIVMTCLEKDRTRRYQSAEALAEDIQRHLNQQPVQARPPSQVYRLRKLVRRNKTAFAAALVIILLAPLLAILFSEVWPSGGNRIMSTEAALRRAEHSLKHYDREGRIAEAMSVLKEASKSDPLDAGIWAKLGWANWLLYGEDERDETRWEAYRCATNATALNPKNAEGHLVEGLIGASFNDWPTATNHLLRAKELTRSADGLVLISMASACQAAKNPVDANSFAQLAEKAADSRWDVWDRIGVFYYKAEPRNQDLTRARASLERAVQCAPDSPIAHRHLGEILLSQKSPGQAMTEFQQSLKLRTTAATLSAIGSALLVRREYGMAANYFTKASGADPSKFLYHVNAGLAYRKMSGAESQAREHLNQALRQTQDSLSAGAENARVRAYQGLCRAALGQTDEARYDLERAQKEAGLDMITLRIVYDGYKLLGDGTLATEVERFMKDNAR
jgi:serine/threonine protein kinase/Tfp pilus assembly protein PilF